jgi:group I intron endonuclease
MECTNVVTANGTSLKVCSVDHVKKFDEVASIYMLFNKVNRKVYIGQTNRTAYRKYTHFINLGVNKHTNSYLQRSYNKYGKDAFEFHVIEFVDDVKNLNEREHYYVHLCGSRLSDYGYNLIIDTRQRDGENVVKSRKGKYTSLHKGVVQLDLEGNFVNEYDSISIAAETNGLQRSLLGKCVNMTRWSTGGFIWVFSSVYQDESFDFNTYVLELKYKSRVYDRQHNKTYANYDDIHKMSLYKTIVQLDLEGNFIKEWECGSATKPFGFKPSKIYNCCNPKTTAKTHYGFKWMYKEDFEKQSLNN